MSKTNLKSKLKCPKCNDNSIAKIIWGEPIYTEKLMKEEKEVKIFVGGCCIPIPKPKWHCNSCEYEW